VKKERLMRTTNASKLGVALTMACAALAMAPAAAADEPAPRATGTVSAVVSSLRNQKGALGCRLFKSSAGFPEASPGSVERRLPILGAAARCEFGELPPGTYAVSVMHDENDNRKLDKNFLGIPTEGYGVSNNKTHAMSSPTWDESKFTVEKGKDVTLTIRLRY
jgi:uncharacterized protein (DUF2141 family)